MTRPRGFAALSPERRAEISRAGGKAAHAAGTAHQWDQESAKEAGRKGAAATLELIKRRKEAERLAAATGAASAGQPASSETDAA